MTRPDLNNSDLAGLDQNAYGQLSPDRQFAAMDRECAAADQPMGSETLAICVMIVAAVGAVAAFIVEWLRWI